jgi:protein-tyrosine phosphatase
MKIKKIAFVCLGNICRSPIAWGVANKYIIDNNISNKFSVESFGTANYHIGKPPCNNSIIICKKYNIDISKQKAMQMNRDKIVDYDYIIGLDSSNVSDLQKISNKKIYLLGDFGFNGEDVPDPYFYPSIDGFDSVFKMVQICTNNFLDSIK